MKWGQTPLTESVAYSKTHAFLNNPWAIIYREIDKRIPGSKLIMTVRDDDAWLASAIKLFSGVKRPELLAFMALIV